DALADSHLRRFSQVMSCPQTLMLAETLHRRPALPLYLLRQSSCTHYSLGPLTSGETIVLLLLPKHLPVGLAVGIKAIMFTPFPSGFQFGPSNVPIRTAFLQHGTQVLPKLFDGRSAKKPVAVVDLEYNETRFENDDMRDHRVVLGVRILGDVEILLNLPSWIR